MIDIHLVRHAQTGANRAGRYSGWSDDPILDGAETSARAVAAQMVTTRPLRLVSSPVLRARQTAAFTADACGLEIVADDGFGELRFGLWEGLTETAIAARFPDQWQIWKTTPEVLQVPGRESLAEVATRVGQALDRLVADFDDRDGGVTAVAVFTHDAVVRMAVAWALDAPASIYRHVKVEHCSITTIRADNQERLLTALNTVSHLSPI